MSWHSASFDSPMAARGVVWVATVIASCLFAYSAAGQTVFRQAENGVPVALIEVYRTSSFTDVRLVVQQAMPGGVCWDLSGSNSPYLLAEGRRYRLIGGDNVVWCPNGRGYAASDVMTLKFEPLHPSVREFSLVEGQGGENQMIDPTSSKRRYWNFLRVRLN